MNFIPTSGWCGVSRPMALAALLSLVAAMPAAAQDVEPAPRGAEFRARVKTTPPAASMPRRAPSRRDVELPPGTVVEYDVRRRLEISPPPQPLEKRGGPTTLEGKDPVRPDELGGEPDAEEAARKITPTRPVARTDLFGTPREMVVKLVASFPMGPDAPCSGVMMGEYHVWTAAHCVYDPASGGWATSAYVVPSQNDRLKPNLEAEEPYGYSFVTYQRMYKEYRQDITKNDYDFAVLTLDRRIGRWTGSMGGNTNVADALNLSGYPVSRPAPFGEQKQYFGFDQNNVRDTTSTTIEMDAFVYGGHSGGPGWHANAGRPILQGIITSSHPTNDAITNLFRTRSYVFEDFARFIRDDEARRPPEAIAELIENTIVTDAKALFTRGVEPGGTIRVRYNAVNAGTAPAENVVIDFYAGASAEELTRGRRIGSVTVGTMPAHSTLRTNATLTIPTDMASGKYLVGWRMRTSGAEYDTTNNTAVIHEPLLEVKSAAKLSIAITDGFVSTGPEGGPFKPNRKTYILFNKGEAPLSWTATSDKTWLYANPDKGTLAPGAGINVNAWIHTANAKALGVGTYTGALTFTNTTNGVGNTTRSAKLTVEKATFFISLGLRPPGAGSVTGGGIFPNGSTQTVTAIANEGWMFDTWIDQRRRVVSNTPAYTFVLKADTTLRATFVQPYYINLAASPENAGTVAGAGPAKPGAQHKVTAEANAGFDFKNWTEGDAVVSTARTYKFTVESSRTLVANFSSEKANDLMVDFGPQGVWRFLNNAPSSWARADFGNPEEMAAADLDGDDRDEIVGRESDGALYRLSASGQSASLDNPAAAQAFAVGDFDGNGKDDVFARFTGTEAIFMKRLNNGAWTDVNMANPPIHDRLIGADVDGNGKDDVVGFGLSTGIGILYDGAASFEHLAPGAIVAAAAGDYDGNGEADLAFAYSDRVVLFRNNINIVQTQLSFGGATKLHFADADGNGRDEIYKLNSTGLWRMNANFSWAQVLESQSANSITALGSADLDGNGKQDLLVQQAGNVLVRMNDAGSFNVLWWVDGAVAEGFAAGRFD